MALDRTKIQKNADKAVKQGKFDQAIKLYNQILEKSPEEMSLRNKVGDLYVKAGKTDDAVKYYTQIAVHYADSGFYLKSIAIYKKINRIDPSRVNIYLELADLYLKQGLKDQAKAQFVTVADLCAKEGNQTKHEEVLARIVEIDPDNVKIRVKLADLYTKSSKLDAALREYRAIGDELTRKEMYEEAERVYEKALSMRAGDPEMTAGLCEVLNKKGSHAKSVELGEAARSKAPDNIALLLALAEAYQRTGAGAKAGEVAAELTRIEPDNEEFQALVSRIGSSEPEDTSSGGSSAEVSLDELAGADYSMEELEQVSGEWLGAPDGIESPELEAPDSGGGEKEDFIVEHTTEAEVFIKYGLMEKAVEHLEAIVSHYPDEVPTLLRLKQLYADGGDKGRAAAMLMEIARAHRAQGDSDAAEQALSEAQTLDPNVLERAGGGGRGAGSADAADVSANEFYAFDESSGAMQAPALEFDTGGGDADQGASALDGGGGDDDQATADGGDEGGFEIDIGTDDEGTIELSTGSDAIDIDLDGAGEKTIELEAPDTEEAGAIEFDFGGPDAEVEEDKNIELFEMKSKAESESPLGGESPLGELGDSDAAVFSEESDFFHMASALEESRTEGEQQGSVGTEESEEDLEEILKQFKEGVDEQLGDEDFETHYQLGIAYKEMGLVDEAIAEFQTAAKSSELFADCCSNLGVCFREKGMPKLAIKWYGKALETMSEESEQYVGLLYDTGEAYQEAGDLDKALQSFSDVYGLDESYRDVADKIQNLGEDDDGSPT